MFHNRRCPPTLDFLALKVNDRNRSRIAARFKTEGEATSFCRRMNKLAETTGWRYSVAKADSIHTTTHS